MILIIIVKKKVRGNSILKRNIIIDRMGNRGLEADQFSVVRRYRPQEWTVLSGPPQQLWRNLNTHQTVVVHPLLH